MRLVERGDAVRDEWLRGQGFQPRAGEHDAEVGPGFVHVNPRLLAERRSRGVRQAVHEPLLAEVVVDDQQPVRLQMILGPP